MIGLVKVNDDNYIVACGLFFVCFGCFEYMEITSKQTPSPALFFLFVFQFYFIFKLYIIVLVLPNIKINPPQVYMCSPSWTFLPPPSPDPPSGLSQCTSPKHPVSCIEPGLVTRFKNIPESQISSKNFFTSKSHWFKFYLLKICGNWFD